jgi:tyrosyl-tRNA synthetase
VEYRDYSVLEADYRSGKVHPGDLKAAVTAGLNRILQPVRDHFSKGAPKELLEKIKKFKVTR